MLLVLMLAIALPACGYSRTWYRLNNPIDAGQLIKMPFGVRSFWLQPWRSSLATRPATSLQNAIGLNLGGSVTPAEMPALARLMRDHGFRRARLEISWSAMSYQDPAALADPSYLAPYVRAMRANGIRPLILLNGNHEAPGPTQPVSLSLASAAPVGATHLLLRPSSVRRVVPGLTGVDVSGVAAKVLITSVDFLGVATLSQPLPVALPAGRLRATMLRFAPFAPPYLADGKSPNPRFQQTLSGWLDYVKAVCQFVRDQYGSDSFDVEVWNELTFGSDFLHESNYYSAVPDPGSTGSVEDALLAATVQMLRDPANGLTGVKIGNGFSNQTPFPSGTSAPVGLSGLDKHPYAGSQTFPGSPGEKGIAVVDAQGQIVGRPTDAIKYAFTPSYRVFMPEYFLTGIQTETLMRDLSPIQTDVYGGAHGAATHPVGGSAPAMWVTEDNLDATTAMANGMPPVNLPEFQAKTALRLFTSFASEGVKAVDLFSANGAACCQVVPRAFFNAVAAHPSSYPANLAGLTMQAVGRMTSTLRGAQAISAPRQLSLDAVASDNNTDVQFRGNGTAAFPSLYNRNVLAFFPFQLSAHKFVCAVYVMTSDLTRHYTSHPAPGATPYDLPPETFRLTIGNVDAGNASVSSYDPLTGTSQPASIVSRTGGRIVVQLQATDSPRMLTINGA
jgi:hypothetical protein